jgi:hypothetical protein
MASASAISMIRSRSSQAVRQFVGNDIPDVARLHSRVWPNPGCTPSVYDEYFRRVFIGNPDSDPALPSLVFEDESGRVVGFIGVVPRRLVADGRTYRAAVSSQFVVEPGPEAAFAAVRLLRAYLEGPQDVSIADEATDAARALWSGLGASTAHFLSMHWTRVLRPARFAASFLRTRRRLRPVAGVLGACSSVADALAARLPNTPFQQPRTFSPPQEISAAIAVAHQEEFCHPSALRVVHDERSFQWLLDRAARASVDHHPVTGVVTGSGRVRGWYIAALDGQGQCDVVHLAAVRTATREVLEALFQHAWQRGACAVSGRADVRFTPALTDTSCVFHQRGHWMLVNTASVDLLRAFESGSACFARLDGEWALRLSTPDSRGGLS